MKVEITIERGEKDIDVFVEVDEGVPSRYAHDALKSNWLYDLTDEERDRAREVWEKLDA